MEKGGAVHQPRSRMACEKRAETSIKFPFKYESAADCHTEKALILENIVTDEKTIGVDSQVQISSPYGA